LIITLPYYVDYKHGSTIHNYEYDEFSTLKAVFGNKSDGPKELTVVDCDNDQAIIDMGKSTHKVHNKIHNGSVILP